jgi:hypothetical protein
MKAKKAFATHPASQGARMRKTALSLAVVVFVVASMFDLHAASLAGVTLPDTVQVGGTTLVLNGLGLRKKFVVKVYVAGLYLEQKSSDAGAIIKADAPKRIVMQFLHGASKSQMADAFDESFNNNAPDAKKTMKADMTGCWARSSPSRRATKWSSLTSPARARPSPSTARTS